MNIKVKAATISIVVNVFLSLLKLFLALLTGSLALLADAYHSASDIVVSILVFVGIKISDRERTSTTLRISIENGLAIVISLFIFFAAYTVFVEAITRSITVIKFLPLAILGTIIGIITCYLLSSYKIHVGKLTKSPSLVADGYHSRTDMYSSVVVLVALVGYMIGLRIDAPAAIIIVFFIASVGVELFGSSIKTLLNKVPFTFTPLHLQRFPFLINFKQKFLQAFTRYKKPIFRIAFSCIVVGYMLTGFYMVGPGEEAVVQRFGSLARQKIKSGLHYALPRPFEKATILSTYEIHRVEIGFRTRKKVLEEPEAYLWQITHEIGKYEKRYDEALMITGDMNIVDADLVIQYQVENPKEYLFNSENPEKLIRVTAENATRQIVASENIDDLLTEKRSVIENMIKKSIEDNLKDYGVGIQLLCVSIHEIHPPLDVVPAFRSVINAKEDKERFIHEAEAEFNEKIPEVEAEATEMIEKSKAYLVEKPNYALGVSQRFTKQSKSHKKSPEVSGIRLYLETVENVLLDVNKYIIVAPGRRGVLDLRPLLKSVQE